MPDMAQTLAAVAAFADSPTRVRGVGFIRGHETDRITAVVTELRRLGIEAHEHADGFTIVPGAPQPATIETYGDHRMAMAFTVIAMRAKGISIADPGCVAKTFPTSGGARPASGRRGSSRLRSSTSPSAEGAK